MSGSGSTVVLSGASATLGSGALLAGPRELVNEGTATLNSGHLNTTGTGATPSILNTGIFEKSVGSEESEVYVNFVNDGRVVAFKGELMFFEGGSWSGCGRIMGGRRRVGPVQEWRRFAIMEGTELSGVQVEKDATVVGFRVAFRGRWGRYHRMCRGR